MSQNLDSNTEEFEVNVTARGYVIYHPDGKTTRISSSGQIDCEVQSGFLVVKIGNVTHQIYNPKDWVSVNVPPR